MSTLIRRWWKCWIAGACFGISLGNLAGSITLGMWWHSLWYAIGSYGWYRLMRAWAPRFGQEDTTHAR
jgi:hypothetical protein